MGLQRDPECPSADEEQLLYAQILQAGMYVGLAFLFVTYALYLSGIVAPGIPMEDLPEYWEMSVDDYLVAVNADHLHLEHTVTGWSWLSVLRYGEYLNYLGIALLSAITIICYVGIVPTLIRKRDKAYVSIAVLQVAILTLAASGVLTAGH
jgi:hypothetical protein